MMWSQGNSKVQPPVFLFGLGRKGRRPPLGRNDHLLPPGQPEQIRLERLSCLEATQLAPLWLLSGSTLLTLVN